jgi:hypothetical protein
VNVPEVTVYSEFEDVLEGDGLETRVRSRLMRVLDFDPARHSKNVIGCGAGVVDAQERQLWVPLHAPVH